MLKNRAIWVRVTKEQHQLVQKLAEEKGYGTISGYLRSVALRNNETEKAIKRNNLAVKGIIIRLERLFDQK